MTGKIGYYVHHHGAGHRQRAELIAAHLPTQITLLGTGLAGRVGNIACVDLPDDQLSGKGLDDDRKFGAQQPIALHFAPLAHDGVRKRVALMTDWIMRQHPDLMVVDVSVEVAMLARLASTPTVYVRLSGLRTDPAHLDAFRGAQALLAPFHSDLDDPAMPTWVRAKTYYAPGLTPAPTLAASREDVIIVVQGKGGVCLEGEKLAAAARATPELRWRVIGPATIPAAIPANLRILGWIDNPQVEIAQAGIVVGGAGDGVVNAVLMAQRPFVCLPEKRPFDEQVCKARRLAALGAAVTLTTWPAPTSWRSIFERARMSHNPGTARLTRPNSAALTADWLSRIAKGGDHAARCCISAVSSAP